MLGLAAPGSRKTVRVPSRGRVRRGASPTVNDPGWWSNVRSCTLLQEFMQTGRRRNAASPSDGGAARHRTAPGSFEAKRRSRRPEANRRPVKNHQFIIVGRRHEPADFPSLSQFARVRKDGGSTGRWMRRTPTLGHRKRLPVRRLGTGSTGVAGRGSRRADTILKRSGIDTAMRTQGTKGARCAGDSKVP